MAVLTILPPKTAINKTAISQKNCNKIKNSGFITILPPENGN